jgi:hypothetical protein
MQKNLSATGARRGASLAAVGLYLATGTTSLAQEVALPQIEPAASPTIENGVELDVRRRHRPEFDPIGLPLGNWRLFPSVGGGVGFESNVFGDETNRKSDVYFQVEPAVTLQSETSHSVLKLDASGRLARFSRQSEANEDSYQVAGYGKYDFGQETVVEGGASFAQLIERRDSSGFPDGRVAPVRYHRTQFYVAGRRDFARLRLLATADYTIFNFSDTRALSASGAVIGVIDQDARDQSIIRGSFRAEYSVGPGIATFAQVVAESIDYRLKQTSAGIPNLGGKSYTALAGISLGSGQLVRGSVGVGYVWREYESAAARSVNGLAINAELSYYLSPLLTLSATASRSVQEAVLQDASSYVSTAVGVNADYELKRWIIVHVGGSFRYDDFRDNPRTGTVYEAQAGVRYSANRRLSFNLDGNYVNRKVKNDPFAASYDDFTILAGARFSF